MLHIKRTLCLSACGISILPAIAGTEKQPEKPNIIVILADDIGYGDLGAYGATRVKTPNFDRLAANGARFTNAYAVAATSTPSRYSLLTGEYAFRRKNTAVAPGNATVIIKPEQETLPRTIQQAGYKTAVVGKWHLGIGDERSQDWNGYLSPGPKELGFDYSYIMAATGDRVPCVFVENQRIANLDPNDPIEVSYGKPFPDEPLGRTHPELLTKLKSSPGQGHLDAIINGVGRIGYSRGGKSALWIDENIADSITAKAVSFIERNKENPFFLYFGTNDVHVPRVPHPRFVGQTGMGARGDAIAEFDWSIGQVIEALERNGLMENTLIIVTSDNGPVLDDGYQDGAVKLLGDHKPWGPLRGGKYSIFEAGTRVPFIIHWPAGIKPTRSAALVSQVDMYATLAALIGQSLPEKAAPDSFNQLKAWTGKDKKGRTYVFEQAETHSIVKGNWKYIKPNGGSSYWALTETETGLDKKEQLYDLSKDLGEKNNLAERNPKKVAELAALLEQVNKANRTR